MRSKIPWWKRHYLVNRELQLRYAFGSFFITLVSSLLTGALIIWAFRVFHVWQEEQQLPPLMIFVIVICLSANMILVFILTILSTHRIVGPVFNLLRQFQILSMGDFSAFAKFRKTDEMQYVARKFNEMVFLLKARNESMEKNIIHMEQLLQNQEYDKALQACLQLKDMVTSKPKEYKE